MRFYLRMAWRSLRSTRGVTVVMIVALSLGIGTWYTQRQIFEFMGSKEPTAPPNVFHIALERGSIVTTDLRPQLVMPILGSLLLTPHDARGVLGASTMRSTMTFGARGLLEVEGHPPEAIRVRYSTPDLFPLFEIPLAAGRVWSADGEGVIEEHVARRIFGSAMEALDRTVRIDGVDVRITGVVAGHHRERYHLYERFVPTPIALYLPMSRSAGAEPDFRHVIADGEAGVMSAWVELPTIVDHTAFVASVTAYLTSERGAGRASAPFAVTLRSSADVRAMFAPGGTINLWPLLAAMCLVTCVVNLVRMLIMKFGGRRHDLGLLRAFGARQRGVMGQLLLEALVIGLVAGVAGVLLGVAMMPVAMTTLEATPAGVIGSPDIISARAVLTTIGVSIGAALLAAGYPAWLLSRGTPAAQLGRS